MRATINSSCRCIFSAAALGRAALVLAVLLVLGAAAGSAAAQSIAVPAYFYPGGSPDYWTQLGQAGPGALAVMNPDSGPGSAPDPNYVSAVEAAEAAGITVVGYVYTSYGSRSLRAVESDVNKYYNWYPVQGIFFDEASTSCSQEPYYAQLNSFVKAKGGVARTVLNPGTQTNQCYASAADTLLTFEGSDSEYVNSYSAPSWVSSYPASRFWHVIYGTSTTSAMATAVQLSKARNAGYVYVTSASLPNPYDVLPTLYWSSELADTGATGALSAPTNTAVPIVSGADTQGQALSTSTGSWSGSPAPTYTYQWQDCGSTGASCTNISGATASSYTLAGGDVGRTIVAVVTATNSQGQASASSTATAVVQAALSAPTNTAVPIVSGADTQGQALSTSTGSWSGSPAPTYTYQWQDCGSTGASCTNISGATASSYTLAGGDVGRTIVAVVTATNSQGQASASSTATAVVQAALSAPTNTAVPIVSGADTQGQALSTSTGSWSGSPAPTYTYQWQDCGSTGASCTNISGATASSYTLAGGDVGRTIVAVVTATNSQGQASASSTATAVVQAALSAPTNTAVPIVSGADTQGQALSTSTGSWSGSPAPTYTYQWQDCGSTGASCTNISGATASSYTLAGGDVGRTIVAVVTATNSQGQASASSTATAVVQAALSAPTNTAVPIVSGADTQGQALSTSTGSWSGSPAPTYTYQWQDCGSTGASCTNISGATASSYTLAGGDVGRTIVAVVTATNSQGHASASSTATAVVQAASSGPPAPSGFRGGDYSVEANTVSLTGTGQALAIQATISSTGTLSDMFVYQEAGISGSPTIEAAVYADKNGYPGAQIGDSASNALSSAGWLDMGGLQVGSAGSMTVTAGQKVWLIIHVQGSSTLKLAEKGGCSGQAWKVTNSPTWLDDPWTSGGTGTSDCSVSAYVTG